MARKVVRKTVCFYPKQLEKWLKFLEEQKPRYSSLSHLIRVAVTELIEKEKRNPLKNLELGDEE